MQKPQIGIMYRREYPPEDLPAFARRAEAAGFAELWVVEDCFYHSGIAPAATALACTSFIRVGLGIMPAVVRNPAFAAMEIATLARLFPGRFLPGIGHGVAGWMHQIGAFPKSQLKALEEVTITIRALLHGEEVNFRGQYVQLSNAKLVHPPAEVPPVSLGVVGPKSLALSGRVADGTILSEYASREYISWAKGEISRGKLAGGHDRPHRLSVFTFACPEHTTNAAREKLRPLVAADLISNDLDTKLEPFGILPQVQAFRSMGGQGQLETYMPDNWIDQLAIAGTPEDWRTALERIASAGVDAIVLMPLPDSNPDSVELFAQHLLT